MNEHYGVVRGYPKVVLQKNAWVKVHRLIGTMRAKSPQRWSRHGSGELSQGRFAPWKVRWKRGGVVPPDCFSQPVS